MKELGRQVYLGGYENEEHAAEAYDVAALKCKGPRVRTNFPLSRCVPLTSQVLLRVVCCMSPDVTLYRAHCKDDGRVCSCLLCRYSDLTECMGSISVEELIMAVRRQSQGFSRGTSAFRGVTHHPSGLHDILFRCC